MIKVTGFTKIPSLEGAKISYTWSEIDDTTGQLASQNNKGSFLVLDNENFLAVLNAIDVIDGYIKEIVIQTKEMS